MTPSIDRLVKSWTKSITVVTPCGKRLGIINEYSLELMVMFNHSTQRQTLDYLCIQAEEIKDAYMRLEL